MTVQHTLYDLINSLEYAKLSVQDDPGGAEQFEITIKVNDVEVQLKPTSATINGLAAIAHSSVNDGLL